MRHLRVLGTVGGVHPVAIPARPERLPELREQGYEACLPDDANLDALVIATDTGRHLADAQNWGDIPLLIEKPLAGAVTPGLVVLADRPNTWVGCCLRFHPVFDALLTLQPTLDHHRATLIHVECKTDLRTWRPARDYRESYGAREGQGGALRELIHEVDYAGWLWGFPDQVVGQIDAPTTLEMGDEQRASFSGGQVTFELDLGWEGEPSRRAKVLLSDGDVEIDIRHNRLILNGDDAPVEANYADLMYERQAKAFVESAQGTPHMHMATARDGLHALQVCDAVRLSSVTGAPVSVDYA